MSHIGTAEETPAVAIGRMRGYLNLKKKKKNGRGETYLSLMGKTQTKQDRKITLQAMAIGNRLSKPQYNGKTYIYQ